MKFQIADAFLPAVLNCHPMTDEEFSAFCAEHPDYDFEMSAEGDLIVSAPRYCEISLRNLKTSSQLHQWAKHDGRGYGCDPSAGFVFPNGARRSPDVSWTLKSRVHALGDKKRNSFWPLCPDFVLEIRGSDDRLKPLRAKMREYLEQGAQLG